MFHFIRQKMFSQAGSIKRTLNDAVNTLYHLWSKPWNMEKKTTTWKKTLLLARFDTYRVDEVEYRRAISTDVSAESASLAIITSEYHDIELVQKTNILEVSITKKMDKTQDDTNKLEDLLSKLEQRTTRTSKTWTSLIRTKLTRNSMNTIPVADNSENLDTTRIRQLNIARLVTRKFFCIKQEIRYHRKHSHSRRLGEDQKDQVQEHQYLSGCSV